MCGADHPHIGMDRSRTAQTLELSLLEDAKNLGLQFQRKIADLVQEQSASVSPFESSDTSCHRSGVGATLVTEQFAFQQTCGNGGAIHLNKRAFRSIAALVNGFRNQFLASACFSIDQHRGVGGGHDPYHPEHSVESVAVTDDPRQSAAAEFVVV